MRYPRRQGPNHRAAILAQPRKARLAPARCLPAVAFLFPGVPGRKGRDACFSNADCPPCGRCENGRWEVFPCAESDAGDAGDDPKDAGDEGDGGVGPVEPGAARLEGSGFPRIMTAGTEATGWESDQEPTQLYVRDRVAGTERLLSRTIDGLPGSGHSSQAAISADGRIIAFVSSATNFVGPPTRQRQLFVSANPFFCPTKP